eukprot:5173660-Amphidinium_carterae.2
MSYCQGRDAKGDAVTRVIIRYVCVLAREIAKRENNLCNSSSYSCTDTGNWANYGSNVHSTRVPPP